MAESLVIARFSIRSLIRKIVKSYVVHGGAIPEPNQPRTPNEVVNLERSGSWPTQWAGAGAGPFLIRNQAMTPTGRPPLGWRLVGGQTGTARTSAVPVVMGLYVHP